MPLVAPIYVEPNTRAFLANLKVTIDTVTVGAGQPIRIVKIDGLDDLPDLRKNDAGLPDQDGDSTSRDRANGRYVTISMVAQGETGVAALTGLRGVTLPDASRVLTVSGMPGYDDIRLTGKVRRRRIPTDRELTAGVARPDIEFFAPDPRLYSAVETVLTTGPGSTSSGGLTPPLTPPLTPSGSGSGGQVTVTNIGNTTTWPVLTVRGPLPGFDLHQLTQGRVWRYRQELSATDFLVIDMKARTVLLNGLASRRSAMGGAWWDLPTGTSDIRFVPTGPAVGSSMELRMRSAWL